MVCVCITHTLENCFDRCVHFNFIDLIFVHVESLVLIGIALGADKKWTTYARIDSKLEFWGDRRH